MNGEEYIKKYGEEAYEKKLQQSRDWQETHPEKVKEHHQKHNPNHNLKNNPKTSQEISRKGGKYYEKHKLRHKEGLSGEKEKVRGKHQRIWTPYKKIIAPDSELHHQWQAGTANYDGVALVEKQQHQHGYIDVVQILEGEITLFTEAEVRKGGCEI